MALCVDCRVGNSGHRLIRDMMSGIGTKQSTNNCSRQPSFDPLGKERLTRSGMRSAV